MTDEEMENRSNLLRIVKEEKERGKIYLFRDLSILLATIVLNEEKRIKKHCELLNKNGIRFEIISGDVYIDLHSLTQKQIDYWVLKSVKVIEKKYSELGIIINL